MHLSIYPMLSNLYVLQLLAMLVIPVQTIYNTLITVLHNVCALEIAWSPGHSQLFNAGDQATLEMYRWDMLKMKMSMFTDRAISGPKIKKSGQK